MAAAVAGPVVSFAWKLCQSAPLGAEMMNRMPVAIDGMSECAVGQIQTGRQNARKPGLPARRAAQSARVQGGQETGKLEFLGNGGQSAGGGTSYSR